MSRNGRVLFLASIFPLLLMVGAACRLSSQAKPPAGELVWHADFAQVVTEAKRAGQPLFVVLRDPRDEFCKGFDEQVLHPGKELSALAEKFVLVRLTNLRGVDLNVFDFDYDLTWAGFFMNANAHVYGRFGGRDAGPPEAHMTLPGLRYAMRRALAAYRSDPNAPGPPQAPPRKVEQYPDPFMKLIKQEDCIHCHAAYEFSREALHVAGGWRTEMAWVYPYPENIGLTVDDNQPDRIQRVKINSAAYTAGLRVGDRLSKLNGSPIASYADVQYALHRSPAQGNIPISWERGNSPFSTQMALSEGWRETDLAWRRSMHGLSPLACVDGEDLTPQEKAALGLPADNLGFRQDDYVHPIAKTAGIRQNDIIFGLDGKKLAMTMSQFGVYIPMHYRVGDRVVFNILRNGRRIDIPMMLPDRAQFVKARETAE